MGEQGLAELSQRGLIDELKSKNLELCEHCIYGKHAHFSFSTSQHKSTRTLDYVHSDL
ncbi:unnamed protein product [Spirodela intermedia]|uniref:GAG-pre-integrase domain-containing protein n=1 Tax=Spirodela intermedia TaxID=51605 RepID=A0A7I8JB34_SPIIN|nr:unnamed protein product [Spirodela intermedia]CAA6667191.1 unnamed protein product [Spirodela intermedia]